MSCSGKTRKSETCSGKIRTGLTAAKLTATQLINSSAANNHNNCANYDYSMTFLPVLVHILRFILRSGGKSDLTSEDRELSDAMTSITLKLIVVVFSCVFFLLTILVQCNTDALSI